MTGVQNVPVTKDDAGIRLDRWFKRHFPQVRHAYLEKIIRKGQVRVDGARVKANDRLEEGQMIRVPPIPEQGARPAKKTAPSYDLSPHDRDFIRNMVIYEDASVFVLNKPSGLAVQGGTKTKRHVDGLLAGLASRTDGKPRLVHRLDRDTSGALVVARTAGAAAKLAEGFKRRETRKIYWALVSGVPHPLEGEIVASLRKTVIGEDGQERVMALGEEDEEAPLEPVKGSKSAVTRYTVGAHAADTLSWLILWPVTGRTHQLRVHCAAIGVPIIGDRKYGPSEGIANLGAASSKLHLHARSVTFVSPAAGRVTVTAPLSAHMAESWRLFGFEETDEDPFE